MHLRTRESNTPSQTWGLLVSMKLQKTNTPSQTFVYFIWCHMWSKNKHTVTKHGTYLVSQKQTHRHKHGIIGVNEASKTNTPSQTWDLLVSEGSKTNTPSQNMGTGLLVSMKLQKQTHRHKHGTYWCQ